MALMFSIQLFLLVVLLSLLCYEEPVQVHRQHRCKLPRLPIDQSGVFIGFLL
jgi:hypothetical protein